MNKKELVELKKLLLEERERILNNSDNTRKKGDLKISTDDLADEADLASAELNQEIIFTLREKDKTMLAEIDYALERIEDGNYGLCEECDVEISVKRLKIFPTARLCIQHQEEAERKAKTFIA